MTQPQIAAVLVRDKQPNALFGGAIAASINEALSTVIDMTGCNGGTLDAVVNSGSGTFSFAVMGSEIATGVFHQAYLQKDDGTVVVYPAVVSIASTSVSIKIGRIGSKYLKLVPTLSGTANVTFVFTPSMN